MKKTAVILIISFVILGSVLGLWAYSKADGGTISVCVNKTGVMYMVGQGFIRNNCMKNDKLLTWNIQGPQGPQGEKGDEGEPGIQGEQGAPGNAGPTGPSLKVFDANGVEMGYLLNIRTETNRPAVTVFDTNYNKILDFELFTGQLTYTKMAAGNNWFYLSSDCAGIPMITEFNNPYSVYRMQATNKFYITEYNAVQSGPISFNSYRRTTDNICINGYIGSFYYAAPVTEINISNYPGPLEIKEE